MPDTSRTSDDQITLITIYNTTAADVGSDQITDLSPINLSKQINCVSVQQLQA